MFKKLITKRSFKNVLKVTQPHKFGHKSLKGSKFSLVYFNQAKSYCTPTDERDAKLMDLFNSLEGSDTGMVSNDNFFKLIKTSDSNASDRLANNIIKLADLDKDGQIGYSEFKTLFEPLPITSINMRELVQYWSRNTTISDPKAIFDNVWHKIVIAAGLENVYLPREILFLAGAPGAGKGTQTNYVLEQRGIKAPPVVMSSLLKSPSAQQIKSQGGLVGDNEVFTSLMTEITKDVYCGGVLIDGFPRSDLQVELIKKLFDKMSELQLKYNNTVLEKNFPRPRFRMIVFWIDENESVSRQLKRGRDSMKHNLIVKETGNGKLIEVRATDVSMTSSKARYKNFIDYSYKSLSSLKDFFPYNLIDASGSIEQVQAIISHEMQYQSSLELSQQTYDMLQKLPRASDITVSGRQSLVDRLDTYSDQYPDRFRLVIETLNKEIYPVLQRHSLTGRAIVRSINEIWKDPLHIDMAVDVLCDREFEAVAETYPESIKFHVNFKKGRY